MRSLSRLPLAATLILIGAVPAFAQGTIGGSSGTVTSTAPVATTRPAVTAPAAPAHRPVQGTTQAATPANPGGSVHATTPAARPATQAQQAQPARPAAPAAPQAPRATN